MAHYVFLSTYYLVAQSPLRPKWNRKPSLGSGSPSLPAALHDSPKKQGALRTLVEENSFPRQRSYERVTARSAECRGWMPAGRKVAMKTSYCNYRPQHAVLWGYEFNHCRSANFAETRKPNFEITTRETRCRVTNR